MVSSYSQVLEAEMTEHREELAQQLEGNADAAPYTLEGGREDAIAVLRLPDKYRRRLRTTNALERLIQELRRREKVIRIFPNDESAWRLLGAFLAETHEDWSTGRRYFRMDDYFRWRRQQQAAREGFNRRPDRWTSDPEVGGSTPPERALFSQALSPFGDSR